MERGQTVRALLRIIERTHDTTCVRFDLNHDNIVARRFLTGSRSPSTSRPRFPPPTPARIVFAPVARLSAITSTTYAAFGHPSPDGEAPTR
jgi:hypothetical protein